MREKEIEKLANDLEEPRAVRLLAEWLAIEHDKTRLQGDEYMEAAQELYDYLLTIGFRLLPLLREEIKKELLTDEELCKDCGSLKWRDTTWASWCKMGKCIGYKDRKQAAQAQLQKIIKKLEEK